MAERLCETGIAHFFGFLAVTLGDLGDQLQIAAQSVIEAVLHGIVVFCVVAVDLLSDRSDARIHDAHIVRGHISQRASAHALAFVVVVDRRRGVAAVEAEGVVFEKIGRFGFHHLFEKKDVLSRDGNLLQRLGQIEGRVLNARVPVFGRS